MSSSNPPNPNTPPVFNNDAYNYGTAGGVDIDFLDANYLKFPTAQGTEKISNLTTTIITAGSSGSINVNCSSSYEATATAGYITHTSGSNSYYRAINNIPQFIIGNPTTDYAAFTASSTTAAINTYSKPFTLTATSITIPVPLTPTYSGASSGANEIGYTINTNLSGTAVLPPTANVSANMNAGFTIPNGVWFVSIIANISYSIVGATTSYLGLSLSQSTGNMDAQNRQDYVAGLRVGDIYFNYPLIVNSTGGTYYIVGIQQGGTKSLSSLNYKITRIA